MAFADAVLITGMSKVWRYDGITGELSHFTALESALGGSFSNSAPRGEGLLLDDGRAVVVTTRHGGWGQQSLIILDDSPSRDMGKELFRSVYIEAGPFAVRAGFDPTAGLFVPEATDEFCVVTRSGWGTNSPLTVKCARRQPTKDQSSETILSEDRQVPDEPGVVVAHGFAGRLAYITEPASETIRDDDFYPARRLHVYSGTPGQPTGDGSPAHDDLPAPVVRPAAHVQVELCEDDHVDAISALTPEAQLLRMDIKITKPAFFVGYSCYLAEQLTNDLSRKMFGNSYSVRVFPPSVTDWNYQSAAGTEGTVPIYFFPTIGGEEALRNVHEALQ